MPTASREGPSFPRAVLLALAFGMFAVLAWALFLAPAAGGLQPEVSSRLPEAGASNPVTAVLLNFRSYDTLLEIVVLLAAVVSVWSLTHAVPETALLPPSLALSALLRPLVPVMIVSGGYLLWLGSSRPGGAFQAGAVLGAAGVLLLLEGNDTSTPEMRIWISRPLLAVGAVVFLIVALGVMIQGRRLLEYPPEWSGSLILLIEAAATLSIGATLTALFAGARPQEDVSRRKPRGGRGKR